ncbi:MAG: NUDIX hydrolase [Proteobacteria bacterium]|nr:NUDIX hydrolase [Pseudomonadota bacterium]
MHREPLLKLLESFLCVRPSDRERVERVRRFVLDQPDCFERGCVPGHITASAWIVSPDRERFLLTRHRKLGRWLQLGGHADGDPDPLRVALREAREESGMREFEAVPPEGPGLPLDVDVHPIPAHGSEPAHLHYDLRFLLVAGPGQSLVCSAESDELRWFPRARASEVLEEASLRRLAERAGTLSE